MAHGIRRTDWFVPAAFAAALFSSLGARAATVELPVGEPPRAITMTGEAEAKAPPDQAVVSAGTVTQARTASQAVASNAGMMTRVFDALAKLNVPRSAIATSGFTLEPQYSPSDDKRRPNVIVGYQVSNSIAVTLDDVTREGAVLDALIDAGANQSAGVSFSIKDTKPLLDQARAQAAEDALHRAQIYARSLGVTLGPVLSIGEGFGPVMNGQPAPMAMMVSRRSTPIEAGQQSVSATVTVEWAIQ